MKFRLVNTFCCVVILGCHVLAEGGNEITKGSYPFMAYIFYSDESVTESPSGRFLRGAVLVKPSWLITSSLGPALMNELTEGFPRKTLLARLGSVTIDAQFTLNEDEDEQEREVIEIVTPQNHSATQWWHTDISLLKTLTPFNLTSFVNTVTILTDSLINDTTCFFLVFARRSKNTTEDRVLTQLYVELIPGPANECGPYYHKTMICAKDNTENNKQLSTYDANFCQGNRGGPLVCENKVAGAQTYVENNCKSPYLYQQLSVWNNFITCGIEGKCNEEGCANMCTVSNKDATPKAMLKTAQGTKATTTITKPTEIDAPQQVSHVITPVETTTTVTTLTTAKKETVPFDDAVYSTPTPTSKTQLTTKAETLGTTTTAATEGTTAKNETFTWPKENPPQTIISTEEENSVERKINVEARRQNLKARKAKGIATRNVVNFLSLMPICLISLLVYCA